VKAISEAAKRLTGQPMFHILVRANELERQGRDILHFELGDPDFDTPVNVKKAMHDSVVGGQTHYTNPRGIEEFRDAVVDVTENSRRFRPDTEQILVCPGANSGVFYAIGCTTNFGRREEVIVPDPCFPTYISSINFFDARPVKIPLKQENQFRLKPEDVEKAVTEKTRLIIMNSPHNPTGSVMNEDEMRKIYNIAKKYDLYLLSDEVYARMIYHDAETHFSSPSKYDHCRERTIVANGFSKSYAMPGFRLGVVIGPAELIEKMSLLLETSVSCVSPFIQKAGVEALKGDQKPIEDMMNEFRQRRDVIVEGLNSLPGVYCLKPRGAFYAFPNIKDTGFTDKQFFDYMIEKAGVACSPGTIFGDNCKDYVRFSYASAKKQDIIEAVERMRGELEKR